MSRWDDYPRLASAIDFIIEAIVGIIMFAITAAYVVWAVVG